MYEPKRPPYITIIFVSILLLIGAGVYIWAVPLLEQRRAAPEPEASAVTQPPPTATPRVVATPLPTQTATPVPTVTLAASGLRFGLLERDDGCASVHAVLTTLFDETTITTVVFDDAESLYEALATRAIDATLCFQDPTDRPFLTEHVGFLQTIGAPYFDDGATRLQVMVNAAAVVPLREEQPCLLQFLQAMTFDARIDSADSWIATNQTEIDSWRACG